MISGIMRFIFCRGKDAWSRPDVGTAWERQNNKIYLIFNDVVRNIAFIIKPLMKAYHFHGVNQTKAKTPLADFIKKMPEGVQVKVSLNSDEHRSNIGTNCQVKISEKIYTHTSKNGEMERLHQALSDWLGNVPNRDSLIQTHLQGLTSLVYHDPFRTEDPEECRLKSDIFIEAAHRAVERGEDNPKSALRCIDCAFLDNGAVRSTFEIDKNDKTIILTQVCKVQSIDEVNKEATFIISDRNFSYKSEGIDPYTIFCRVLLRK